MNSSRNPLNFPLPYASRASVPEARVGMILQRGGEEFMLSKLDDRFTVAPKSNAPSSWTQQIRGQKQQFLGRTQIADFLVPSNRRDRIMAAARARDSVAFASHVYQIQDNLGTLVYLTDQIAIQFHQGTSDFTQKVIGDRFGLRRLKPVVSIPNTFVFQITYLAQENPVKIANRLMGLSQVMVAEPNVMIQTQKHYRPQDSLYHKQWYLHHTGGNQLTWGSHINVEKAWDITRGSRACTIAVVDDALDLNHPDFQGLGKIVAPRDFKEQDFLPQPSEIEDNHGTACAGICLAEENGNGIVGVAPGCALMPIRTTGFLDDESIEQLFDWAITKGASVISCSWGPAAVNFPLSLRQRAAISRAATEGRKGKGCVIVFASGNANRPVNGFVTERGWPGQVLEGYTKWLAGFPVHPDVIAVSACTSLNKKAVYSNWGKQISVCAPSNNAPPGILLQETGFIETAPQINTYTPGLGVFSTDRTGAIGYSRNDFTGDFGGTSSACPVVAGVAALVLSVNPDLTAREVKRILEQTADKIEDPNPDPQLGFRNGTYDLRGHSEWFGHGKVNAFEAVKTAKQQLAVPLRVIRRVAGQNNERLAIPDYNQLGVTSEIYISDSGRLKDIQVRIDIQHDFLGDLEVSLMAPNGDLVLLQNRTMVRARKLQATYSLQNILAFRQLLNQSVYGVWKLLLVDHALGDTGWLNGWQLTLGV
ncbi:MAG: S8 family serine peptidase [Hormoscilla sp. GM102CHS1]|nr:S8 family serine peptidase [Hormoscilla sp. GM102CHS1]